MNGSADSTGTTLLSQLAQIAAEAQRATTVQKVLETAGTSLWLLGFRLIVAHVEQGRAQILYLCDPDHELRFIRAILDPNGTGLSAPITPDGPVSTVMARNLPDALDDLGAWLTRLLADGHPQPPGGLEAALHHAALDQGILVPVTVRGQAWGVILVTAQSVKHEMVNAFHLFAAQLGSAIESASTIDTLERRSRELEALHALASADASGDSDALANELLRIAAQTTSSDYGILYVLNADGQLVRLGMPYGYSDPELTRRYDHMSANATRTGQVAQSTRGRALSVEQLPPHIGPELAAHGFRQFCIVPLRHGQVRGTLNLVRSREQPYAEDEVRFVEILAGQVAVQIENARLNQEQRARVAELKASYERLERTQSELVLHERLAALGELSAAMAHELRNPLGAIFNALSALRRKLPKPPETADLERIIAEESDRLNRIVGDLLDFAKPYTVERVTTTVEAFIEDAIEGASQVAREASVTLTSQLAPSLPPVEVDTRMIHQALLNLVINAIQASSAGSTVCVRARRDDEGKGVTIEVEDRGSGVPHELRERIFQPFFTTKPTGTGLGLPIVARIMEAHGGSIHLDASPKQGVIFRARIPMMGQQALAPGA